MAESLQADKRCPNCGLWNSRAALACDCGYNFTLGRKIPPPQTTRWSAHLLRPGSSIALLFDIRGRAGRLEFFAMQVIGVIGGSVLFGVGRVLETLLGPDAQNDSLRHDQPPETAGTIVRTSPDTSAVSSPSRSRTLDVFTNRFTWRRTAPVSSQMLRYSDG